MTYQHTLEIKTYKKWLIITVLQTGPKLKTIGVGTLFSDFNKWDLQISEEALAIITDNLNCNFDKVEPVLEIISTDRIWWASNRGILIPPNEVYHVHTIPLHTTCNNTIDEKLINIIDTTK